MSRTNHAEQRIGLLFTVDYPIGIEYFVPTMFRICLGKHH